MATFIDGGDCPKCGGAWIGSPKCPECYPEQFSEKADAEVKAARGKSMMKKFMPFIFVIFLMVATPTVDWWRHLPKNPPPAFSDKLWPSCHWEGSEDKNNWIVVFQIDDLNHQKIAWKQEVATGLSGQAAEKLCDAYVSLYGQDR